MSEKTWIAASDWTSSAQVELPLHYCHGLTTGNKHAQIVILDGGRLGFLNLRGNVADLGFVNAIEHALDVPLPTRPHMFNNVGDCAIYWLGPSEWLITVPGGQETAIERKLRNSLRGHYAVTDVSGGYAQVTLLGKHVELLLQKASPYNFHTSVFVEGQCARTVLAKATGLVSKHTDEVFKLTIRRSFADYLILWLLDAASEFGARVEC